MNALLIFHRLLSAIILNIAKDSLQNNLHSYRLAIKTFNGVHDSIAVISFLSNVDANFYFSIKNLVIKSFPFLKLLKNYSMYIVACRLSLCLLIVHLLFLEYRDYSRIFNS